MIYHTLVRCVLGPPGVNALPGIREEGMLGAARILQLAGEALSLALAPGGGNENPVGQSHGEE